MKKLTTEEFVKRAKDIHGDKYDYSKVEYTGIYNEVCIICPKHGEFWQSPNAHLRGKGCKRCSMEILWENKKKITTESLIIKGKEIYGDKYTYGKTAYNGYNKSFIVTCPLHGDFETNYRNFILKRHGCYKCGKIKMWDNRGRITTEEFIKKAREVHGNKYDYSKVNYKRRDSKVIIICPEHGEFLQTPAKHLEGQECPECNGKLNKAECRLWRRLQEKYNSLNVIHNYYNKDIFGRKSIDIFIPDKNIAIEYQGGEHFVPIKMFGGYKKFIEISKRDMKKYDECKNNGIKLFYFTEEKRYDLSNYIDKVYTKFDELCSEIDKILENWN